MISVQELINYIQEQTGIALAECDCFSGLRVFNGKEHFYNLILNDRYSESQEAIALERLARKSSLISRVEPNGLERVAVFLKNDS